MDKETRNTIILIFLLGVVVYLIALVITGKINEELIKCGVNYSNCNYTTINGMV